MILPPRFWNARSEDGQVSMSAGFFFSATRASLIVYVAGSQDGWPRITYLNQSADGV